MNLKMLSETSPIILHKDINLMKFKNNLNFFLASHICEAKKKFRLFLNFIRFISLCSIMGLVSLNILRFIQAVVYKTYLFISLLYNILPIFLLMGMPPGTLCKLPLGILVCHSVIA